jgi:putative DNA primase/helicase
VPFPETVPAAERDKHLDEKLQAELPGVLNWALRGLERLRKQGGFTGDRTPAMTQETWQKWADSVSRFEKAALTDGDEPLPKSDVYAAYIEYCRQEGIPSDTQHKMTRQLKLEGWEDGKSFINGAQQRCFQQAQFTSRGKQLLEDARAETDNVSEQQRRDTGLGEY